MARASVFHRFRLWLKHKRQPVAQLVVSAPDHYVAISIVLSTCPDARIVRVVNDAHGHNLPFRTVRK